MNRSLPFIFLAALHLVAGRAVPAEACASCAEDARQGTAIVWHDAARAAGKLAEEEGKLLFLIHVSGDFAAAEFT